MKKNFIYNSIGSLVYSFTSLFFLIIVTRINGIGTAGIFTFSFSFSCLVLAFSNYFTRNFQVTDNNKIYKDYDYIYHRIITIVITILISLFFCLNSDYNSYEFVILILLVFYKVIESIGELLYAFIQKNNELYKIGISFFLKGVLGLICFFVIDYLTKNLILSLIGLIVVTLLIVIVYDLRQVKKYNLIKTEYRKDKIVGLFKVGFNPFFFTFLTMYLLNASRYTMDSILDEQNQTIYGIIIMPVTLITLFSKYIIQPYLNEIKELLDKKNYKQINKITLKIFKILFVISVLVILLSYLIGIPVLEFIYNLNLNLYKNSFIIIIIGGCLYSYVSVISTLFIATRDTKFQAVTFAVVSIVTFAISFYLIEKYNMMGSAITFLISMSLLFVIYLYKYIIFFNNKIK